MTTIRFFIILFLLSSCDTKTAQKLKVVISDIDKIHKKNSTLHNKDSIYQIGSYMFMGDDELVFDVIDNHNQLHKLASKGDTLYTDKDTTILGDFTKTQSSIYKKYTLKNIFEDFKVNEIYKGTCAKPKLSTDPESYYYKTMIRDGCIHEGINFAGHYTIAEWGCGMECNMMAVIDRISGRVYFSSKYLPFDTADGHWGITYKKDSRMVIVNSLLLQDYQGYSMQQWRKPWVYEWSGNTFVKLQ